MDKKQLQEALEKASKAFDAAVAANATTQEQRDAQDKVIRETREALAKLENEIREAEQGLPKVKMTDHDRERAKKNFGEMKALVDLQQEKVAKFETQIAEYRKLEKNKSDAEGNKQWEEAGKKTIEFGKDAAKSFSELTAKFVDFFKRSDKTPEQIKQEEEEARKKNEQNPDKTNWLSKITGPGTIGGILGGILMYVIGGAFVGGGPFGKIIRVALAVLGGMVGSNFAKKKFGGGDKAIAGNGAVQNNSNDVAHTPATPVQEKSTYVAADSALEAKLAEAYQKGLNTPLEVGPKDIRINDGFDAPNLPQHGRRDSQLYQRR